jgi:hypothetical protein
MTKESFLAETMQPGEIYAGLILGKDGAPDYHLFLLPGDNEKRMAWQKAVDMAAASGGVLPTRREQSLLFANLKEEFEPGWYWSGEQYAPYPSYAWIQNFDNGTQGNITKSAEGRARAVRRLEI